MTSDLPRWVVLVAVLASVVCLVIWARGQDHHRGQSVGAAPLSQYVTADLPG